MQSNVGCVIKVAPQEYSFLNVIVLRVDVDYFKRIQITKPYHKPDTNTTRSR